MTTTPQKGITGAQQANDIPEIDNTFPNLVTLGSGVAQRLTTGASGILSASDDDDTQDLTWSVTARTSSSSSVGVFGTFQVLQSSDGRLFNWQYTLTQDDIVTLNEHNFEIVPAKPDTVTLGAGRELRLTSKTPGSSAEAGDDIPQIHARLVISNVAEPSVVVAPDRSGDEVNITITVAAGTSWQQIQNFINTGNLFGGSGTSVAAQYVTASIDDDDDVGEPVDASDLTGAVPKFDSALLVDAAGINQIRLTARVPGDGDSSSTDHIPEITFTLTQSTNPTGSGFRFNDNRNDGTLAITYNAGAGETWASIVNKINAFVRYPSVDGLDRQASYYIRADFVGADSGDVAEPIDSVKLTGALGVPDQLIVTPSFHGDNFNKNGNDIQIIFSSLLEPDADKDINITLQAGSPSGLSREDDPRSTDINVTESDSEINITILYTFGGTLWTELVDDVREHRVASKYIVASLPYTSSSFNAETFLRGNNSITFYDSNSARALTLTRTLTDGMGATGDFFMPVTADTIMFGEFGELLLTSKTPGASAVTGDNIPQIRANLVVANSGTASIQATDAPDQVDITITAVAGTTTWGQVVNLINTGSISGGSGTSAATEHIVASVVILDGGNDRGVVLNDRSGELVATADASGGLLALTGGAGEMNPPEFETLTGGADAIVPEDLTLTYTIRASDGAASDEEDFTIIFSAENNAPNLFDSDTTENILTEGAAIDTASATLEFRDPNHFEDANADLIIVASITEDGLTGNVVAPTTGRISEGSSNPTIEGMYGDFTLTRTSGTGGALGQIVWSYEIDDARASALPAYELDNSVPVAGTFGTDTLYVRVWDDDDASSEIISVEVEVRGANDVPTVATASIAINGAGSITLTDENINFTDDDASEDLAMVIYRIAAVPSGARITRNDVELSVGGTFTHQDILDGWVTLDVSNANLLSGLRLTVDDDEGARSAAVSLDIQARDVVSIARPEASNNADYSTDTRNLVIDTGDFNDQIRAARGSDFITGGLGDDAINLDSGDGGGSGQDTVVYNFGSGSIFTATDGGDDITSFKRGEDIFLLKTVSDNPELATLDGLFSYVSGPNKGSSHDDLMIVRPNYEYESDGSGGLNFFLTGIEFHFEDGGVYGNGYLAQGRVSITFDERLTWNEFLSLIEIDNGDGGIDGNFDHYRGIIRDLSTLPNLMGEGSLAYERQGAILPIEIAPSGVNSVDETPLNPITQVQTLTQRTEVTYFVLNGVAAGDLRLVRVDPDRDQDPTGFFELDGNVLYLKSGISLDYDSTDRTLNVRVQDVNDSAVGVDVKVKVENVNDVAPVFISGTLVRFNPNNIVVYDAAATFDRTRLVWSLKQEDDHELLEIDIDTGEVRFKGTNRPAEDTAYSFTVVATSGALAPVEQQVTIYPTGYTAPVIADTVGSIQDGEARRGNTPDAVSGAFMVTSGLDIDWTWQRVGTDYGELSFTDDNEWVFTLNNAGIGKINGLDADNPLAVATFDVTATNILNSDMARLTINLQGYAPTGAPVLRNDDVNVTIAVDSVASGQIGFTGDADGTAFTTALITPTGRYGFGGGAYRDVTGDTGESIDIIGGLGTLTLNHDGSWTYALRYDDRDTIAIQNPETRRVGSKAIETFSLGYRSGNAGAVMVQDIDIAVTIPGELLVTNTFTQSRAYGFLPASGQITSERVINERGTKMTLDHTELVYGVGGTTADAEANLNSRIAADSGASGSTSFRLRLGLDQNDQVATPGVIYGLFRFDYRDGSWTYTITEQQTPRNGNGRVETDGNGKHDFGDIVSLAVFFAVQDITGDKSASPSSVSIRGASVIEHPYLRMRLDDETTRKPGEHLPTAIEDYDELLVGRRSVIDTIDTGEGTNGVIGLGGDDDITLGNGIRFHPGSNTGVLDPQKDVVYHRVHFRDTNDDNRWDNARNVDGKDTIKNFIRNEDQFIFIEWTTGGDGVKISEENFLANNALVFLTATIEQSGAVFTLAGFKIGFARDGSDAITFGYHNDESKKSKVALTNAEGILTTDDILAQYGLASTVRDGKHVIADNQQIRGAEVRHNYFGDTNEDSFQILDAIPNAFIEFF